MKDFYERKINYLRVSIIDKCNLKCIYCNPQCIPNSEVVKTYITPKEVGCFIEAFSELGGNKVRFTGGEPLIAENIEEYIYETSKNKNIKDISITTNGILLYDKIDSLKKVGLNRVNVSLDTLKSDRYEKITGFNSMDKVIKGIERTLELNLHPVKIDSVLLKGINDDEISEFIKFIEYYPVEVRFIELMPIGEASKIFKENYISANEILKRHPELVSIGHESGSVAELYQTQRSKGKIGFISAVSNKFCSECNRIRLTSDGKIKPCLHNPEEYSVIEFIDRVLKSEKNSDAYDELKNEIVRVLQLKPLKHNLSKNNDSNSQRAMFQIGG